MFRPCDVLTSRESQDSHPGHGTCANRASCQNQRVDNSAPRCRTLRSGTAIPRFIGLAYAKTKRGEEIGCLMTELSGSSPDCAFNLLTRSEKCVGRCNTYILVRHLTVLLRATILNHLQALHTESLLHADFAWRSAIPLYLPASRCKRSASPNLKAISYS